jgi:hypothetical protein
MKKKHATMKEGKIVQYVLEITIAICQKSESVNRASLNREVLIYMSGLRA